MFHASYGLNHITNLGELLASSTMGVTLFDLFGEIDDYDCLKIDIFTSCKKNVLFYIAKLPKASFI